LTLPAIAPCGGVVYGFDDAASLATLFTPEGCATIVNGALRLVATAGSGDCFVRLNQLLDVQACQLSIRITSVPTGAASVGMFFSDSALDAHVAFTVFADHAFVGTREGPVYATWYDEAFDPSATPYMRIRGESDELFFDSSTDGVCFTPLGSVPRPAWMAVPVPFDISVDHDNTLPTPDEATVDDLNL
jgi:hypothetical protein